MVPVITVFFGKLDMFVRIQYAGDKGAADRFIDQYAVRKDDLHGLVAGNIRNAQRYRFRLFKYAALGE